MPNIARSADHHRLCLRCGHSFPETAYPPVPKPDKELPQQNWICKACFPMKGAMPLVMQRGYPQFDVKSVFAGYRFKRFRLGDTVNECEVELPGKLGAIYAFAENRLACRV